MAPSRALARPLAFLKSSIRHSQQQRRCIATQNASAARKDDEPPIMNFPPPRGYSKALPPRGPKRTHKPIPIHASPPSPLKKCPNPIQALTLSQLSLLDPTGARSRLFSKSNPEGAKVGDILLVRQRSGEPFAGVCVNIRRGAPGHGVKRGGLGTTREGEAIEERGGLAIDTAVLLRNTVARVGVEMWFKVFSPNVVGVEVVQKAERRMRRARAYYLRNPKHDPGNVDNIVRQYLRKNTLLGSRGAKGAGAGAGSKHGKHKK